MSKWIPKEKIDTNYDNGEDFQIPHDVTPEELEFLEIVKERMMQRLGDDRCRLIFIMKFEMGKDQVQISRALGVHETEISRQMENIRARLWPFRKGYSKL